MTPYRLTLSENPGAADVIFLQDRLYEYNVEKTGRDDGRWLALSLRDRDGHIVAGLHGWTWAGWLKVSMFWVREDLRRQGHGTRLLKAAEEEAVTRGCRHAMVRTYSFQAPAFYQRLGYRVVAVVEGFPVDHTDLTLVKDLG